MSRRQGKKQQQQQQQQQRSSTCQFSMSNAMYNPVTPPPLPSAYRAKKVYKNGNDDDENGKSGNRLAPGDKDDNERHDTNNQNNQKSQEEKKKQQVWVCAYCTFENPIKKRRCQMCENRRVISPVRVVADKGRKNGNGKNDNGNNKDNDNDSNRNTVTPYAQQLPPLRFQQNDTASSSSSSSSSSRLSSRKRLQRTRTTTTTKATTKTETETKTGTIGGEVFSDLSQQSEKSYSKIDPDMKFVHVSLVVNGKPYDPRFEDHSNRRTSRRSSSRNSRSRIHSSLSTSSSSSSCSSSVGGGRLVACFGSGDWPTQQHSNVAASAATTAPKLMTSTSTGSNNAKNTNTDGDDVTVEQPKQHEQQEEQIHVTPTKKRRPDEMEMSYSSYSDDIKDKENQPFMNQKSNGHRQEKDNNKRRKGDVNVNVDDDKYKCDDNDGTSTLEKMSGDGASSNKTNAHSTAKGLHGENDGAASTLQSIPGDEQQEKPNQDMTPTGKDKKIGTPATTTPTKTNIDPFCNSSTSPPPPPPFAPSSSHTTPHTGEKWQTQPSSTPNLFMYYHKTTSTEPNTGQKSHESPSAERKVVKANNPTAPLLKTPNRDADTGMEDAIASTEVACAAPETRCDSTSTSSAASNVSSSATTDPIRELQTQPPVPPPSAKPSKYQTTTKMQQLRRLIPQKRRISSDDAGDGDGNGDGVTTASGLGTAAAAAAAVTSVAPNGTGPAPSPQSPKSFTSHTSHSTLSQVSSFRYGAATETATRRSIIFGRTPPPRPPSVVVAASRKVNGGGGGGGGINSPNTMDHFAPSSFSSAPVFAYTPPTQEDNDINNNNKNGEEEDEEEETNAINPYRSSSLLLEYDSPTKNASSQSSSICSTDNHDNETEHAKRQDGYDEYQPHHHTKETTTTTATTSISKPTLASFTTAGSGKTIHVSESSLQRANQIFENDVSTNQDDSRFCMNKKDDDGFVMPRKPNKLLTAATFSMAGSGKTIHVSESSLERANRILGNENMSSLNTPKPPPPTSTSPPTPTPTPTRRKTPLSNAAMFDSNNRNKNNKAHSAMATFTTAGSGTTIRLSESSIRRATKIFDEDLTVPLHDTAKSSSGGIGSKASEHRLVPPTSTTLKTTTHASFTMAGSGKTIHVSESSLRRANQMFENDSIANQDNSKKNFGNGDRFVMPRKVKNAAATTGAAAVASFSMAGSGKTIHVSKSSLERADRILGNRPSNKREENSCSSLIAGHPKQSKPLDSMSASFAMAGSGRKINVTAAGTERAKQILGEDHPSHTGTRMATPTMTSPSDVRENSPPTVASFKMAGSGTKIQVSESSMDRANRVLGDDKLYAKKTKTVFSSGGIATVQQQPKATVVATSFAMAGSGKSIQVSASSSERANQILAGDTSSKEASCAFDSIPAPSRPGPGPGPAVTSFATAGSGKSIQVSASSWERANRVLGNETPARDATKSSDTTTKPNRITPSFTVAGSRKAIQVSASSLERAKKLLGDNDASPSHTADNIQKSTIRDSHPKKGAASFATARSGKRIHVSPSALAHADRIFGKKTQFNEASKTETSTTDPSNNVRTVANFTTARSGKKIQVSASSLGRANRVLGNDVSADSKKGCLSDPNPSPPKRFKHVGVSFSTAGMGTKIEVSASSLERANRIFERDGEKRTEKTAESAATSKPASVAASFAMTVSGKRARAPARSLERGNGRYKNGLGRVSTPDTGELRPHLTANNEDLHHTRAENFQHGTANQTNRPHDTTPGLTADDIQSETGTSTTQSSQTEVDRILAGGCGTSCPKKMTSPVPGLDLGSVVDTENDADACSPRRQIFQLSQDTSIQSSTGSTPPTEDNNDNKQGDHQTPKPKRSDDTSDGDIIHRQDTAEGKATVLTPKTGSGTPRNQQIRWGSIRRVTYGITPSGTSTARQGDEERTSLTDITGQAESTHAGSFPATPKVQSAGRKLFAKVTTSLTTSERNDRKRKASDRDEILTPVPIRFAQEQGSSQESFGRAEEDVSSVSEGTAVDNRSEDHVVTLTDAYNAGVLNTDPEVCRDHDVADVTMIVNCENAPLLRFGIYGGSPVGFESVESGSTAGGSRGTISDLKDDLVDRGCTERLLSDTWLTNHCRWITWKLAAYERKFPSFLGGRHLTYDNLIDQLQGRYERELKGGQRPAVRMILNRDASASRLIILAVSRILKSPARENTVKVELTDGWYPIQAAFDHVLGGFVESGRIKVGTKLVLSNARLVGADDGIDPLDVNYDSSSWSCQVGLKVFANSSRIAKWNARLGWVTPTRQSNPDGCLVVKRVSDIIPGGGIVPSIRLVVQRCYPLLYYEKTPCEKDGTTGSYRSPVLTTAEEDQRRRALEQRTDRAVERLTERMQKEVEKEVDDDAPELWQQLVNSTSPEEYFETLHPDDKVIVSRWKEKRSELIRRRTQQEVQAELETDDSLVRESIPFVRFKVCSSTGEPSRKYEEAMLTIWNPSEEHLSVLQEGAAVGVRNLTVRDTLYDGVLQLTASTSTSFERIVNDGEEPSQEGYGHEKRRNLSMFQIHAIAHKLTNDSVDMSRCLVDIDTTLVLVKVVPPDDETRTFRLYLTDETNLMMCLHCSTVPSALEPKGDVSTSTTRWFSPQRHRHAETYKSASFGDLRLASFDYERDYVLCKFCDTSSCSVATTPRMENIQKWVSSPTGTRELLRLSQYLSARLPIRSRAGISDAFGYVLDLKSCGDEKLLIEVDTGMPGTMQWELSMSCLQKMLSIARENEWNVSLDAYDEDRVAGLETLGPILRARGVLWRFTLLPNAEPASQPGCYIVADIDETDKEMLGSILLANRA